ncbi:ATP-binding protein [Candidatus Woesearchaeota archaeon]|nr:ATP-binding protein [Candidatus Woesearchaeota archaeon]
MYDIIIGRDETDKKNFGSKGVILLGKQYVQMGQTTSLSNPVYLDVIRSHVFFICGKRGSGKSYTMGVIAEGISDLPAEVKQNISVIMLDTMGVYWTMKYPNKKDELLLKQYGMKSKALDVKIYTPVGFHKKFLKEGIPTDAAFSIKPNELDANDWCLTFGVKRTEPIGVLIERIINKLKGEKPEYSVEDIVQEVQNDDRSEQAVKDAVENRFLNTETWGLFDVQGTTLRELAVGGQVAILDVSCYATAANGWEIKNLVIALIAQKLFIQRMIARKDEEYKQVQSSIQFGGEEAKQEMPLVWLVVDEAHEFLPHEGKTAATDALVTILREGRQPGISLILATQQPGKIHTDVMTQADIVLSHRITAKPDVEALGLLMQSYMREGLNAQLDKLPSAKGAAIIFDDTNERAYPLRIRPRLTWHGGESPIAIHSTGTNLQ